MLLCNAMVIDPVLGIVKGDIGIKDGKIVGIGKAGNPATMDGVHPEPDRRRGDHGARCRRPDRHARRHRRARPFRLARSSASTRSRSGITTMIGGSLGPITVGIDCGGAFNVGKMLQAAEHWPINFGFLGRGNTSQAGLAPRADRAAAASA